MMQGWYYVESLTGQRHDRVQTESQIATVRLQFGFQFGLYHVVADSIMSLPAAFSFAVLCTIMLKKRTNSANKCIFWKGYFFVSLYAKTVIKTRQICAISEALTLNNMPPEPPRGHRLRRAIIRTPLRQILDPPQPRATKLDSAR